MRLAQWLTHVTVNRKIVDSVQGSHPARMLYYELGKWHGRSLWEKFLKVVKNPTASYGPPFVMRFDVQRFTFVNFWFDFIFTASS